MPSCWPPSSSPARTASAPCRCRSGRWKCCATRSRAWSGKIIEMIRHGQENVAIADRLHRWTRALMLTANAGDLPEVLVRELKHQFLIPQAGIRLWGAADAFAGLPFARPVSDDVKSFAASLTLPYCGVNSGFEAARWLDDAGQRDVDGDDPAAPRRGDRGLRPAGAGLARPDALQRRHGHRVPAAHRRDRQRRRCRGCCRSVIADGRRAGARRRHRGATCVHLRGRAAPRGAHAGAVRRGLRAAAAASPPTAGVALRAVQAHHVRRWAAQLHAQGLAPRSIAHRAVGLARPVPLAGPRRPGGAEPGRRRARAQGRPSRCPRRCRSTRRWRWPSTTSDERATRCSPRATTASSSCSTAAACASANWSGWTCGASGAGRRLDRRAPTPPRTCSARAASGAACRWARAALEALAALAASCAAQLASPASRRCSSAARHAADAPARCARA